MAQFVLGVDLEIQKVLGLEAVKTQLSSVAGSTVNVGVNVGTSNGLNNLTSSLNTLKSQSEAAGINLSKFKVSSDSATGSLKVTGSTATEAAKSIGGFSDQIFLAGKRYAAFIASTAIAFKGFQLIGEATKSAIEFESEMVRLDQILDEGSARLDTLKQKFLELSVVTGTSVKDLAEVATILAQAGLGNAIDAALEPLSKVPLLPSFKDMKQTTEGLVAVFKQFGLQGSDTSQILDLLNETANKFAVTSEDVIEGIKRGGSAFAATGGTLKEFI